MQVQWQINTLQHITLSSPSQHQAWGCILPHGSIGPATFLQHTHVLLLLSACTEAGEVMTAHLRSTPIVGCHDAEYSFSCSTHRVATQCF
jgi:hypothetical protein